MTANLNFTISVRSGQTASQLAQIYGVPQKNIPTNIKAGQTITIPMTEKKVEQRREKESSETKAATITKYALEKKQAELQELKNFLKQVAFEKDKYIIQQQIKEAEKEIDALEDKVLLQYQTATTKDVIVKSKFCGIKYDDEKVRITIKKPISVADLKALYNIEDGHLRKYAGTAYWAGQSRGWVPDESKLIPAGTVIELDSADFDTERPQP